MTRVWVEVDDAIISITLGKTHELTGRTFYSHLLSALMIIPGHGLLSVAEVGAARFHCLGKRSKEGDHGKRYSTRYGRGIE